MDPDVVEAAGLAHDLGHPPFGHIAEAELQVLAKAKLESVEGFEGNAQSFRIVTKLAVRTKEQSLDLTRATLNAILKYPWSKQTEDDSEKWGIYVTERDEFDEARKAAPYKNSKTLEAELMDWADDVAYAVYDLDDFYRAGLIPLDRLLERGRHFEALFENIEARWRRRKMPVNELRAHKDQFNKLLKPLSTRHPLKNAYSGAGEQRAALREVTSWLVNRYAGAIELADIRRGSPVEADERGIIRGPTPVVIQKKLKMEVTILKELAWTYVIEDPALAAQQEGQKAIIRLLFEKFSDAAYKQNWRIFPAGMRFDLEASNIDWKTETRKRTRVVLDLISSMTEVEAIEMYRRLTGFSSGSVLQRIIH